MREFVDKNRKVALRYWKVLEDLEEGRLTTKKAIKKLREIIRKDPDFLDPYLTICELLWEEGKEEEADRVLDEAYQRALRLITDEEGNWPDRLEWGWLENRHILRTLLNKGIERWDKGYTEEALSIFRNLLRTNPNDNLGVRDFILAIRKGMSYEEFERRFNKGGYYDSELVEWFEKHYKEFPDEFEWWERYWADQES